MSDEFVASPVSDSSDGGQIAIPLPAPTEVSGPTEDEIDQAAGRFYCPEPGCPRSKGGDLEPFQSAPSLRGHIVVGHATPEQKAQRKLKRQETDERKREEARKAAERLRKRLYRQSRTSTQPTLDEVIAEPTADVIDIIDPLAAAKAAAYNALITVYKSKSVPIDEIDDFIALREQLIQVGLKQSSSE